MGQELDGDKHASQGAPAVSIILRHEGRYLLVKRKNPPARDLYAFPGGRVEADETLASAALRELHEETGLHARDPVPLTTFDLVTRADDGTVSSHFFLTVFRAAYIGGTATAADDAAEAGWFTPQEISALPVPDSVTTCIALAEKADG